MQLRLVLRRYTRDIGIFAFSFQKRGNSASNLCLVCLRPRELSLPELEVIQLTVAVRGHADFREVKHVECKIGGLRYTMRSENHF